jgi:hypothetical protein
VARQHQRFSWLHARVPSWLLKRSGLEAHGIQYGNNADAIGMSVRADFSNLNPTTIVAFAIERD